MRVSGNLTLTKNKQQAWVLFCVSVLEKQWGKTGWKDVLSGM